ncbi:hypothetical protein T12_14986 [Trichinella patagoniensis]|uniref:Uncharacterized protein n=1 Tax=Trichinella patagoniensis TaxID=990121 RepID=A0A0V1A2U8_9BILA|nr:hypothetical protein T12_14986 [Trichinella patagoniensis]
MLKKIGAPLPGRLAPIFLCLAQRRTMVAQATGPYLEDATSESFHNSAHIRLLCAYIGTSIASVFSECVRLAFSNALRESNTAGESGGCAGY